MRDIWVDGSSARKRSWDTPYNQSSYTNSNYHPNVHERRQASAIQIEYIEPPERYAVNHPIKTAINKTAAHATDKAVQVAHAIPTIVIRDINAGMLLATKWLNVAMSAVILLIVFAGWGSAAVNVFREMLPAEILWHYGVAIATAFTIVILLMYSNKSLHRRCERAQVLKKRKTITNSLKRTLFLFGRTLVFMYCVVVPSLAHIMQIFIYQSS